VSLKVAKARSYEILESINFVIITKNKIYSCKVVDLLFDNVKIPVGSRRDTLPDEVLSLSKISQLDTLTVNNTSVTINGFDTANFYIDNRTTDSFPLVAPMLGIRVVRGISANVISVKDHLVTDYLPDRKYQVIIPNMAYFDSGNTILTKANPNKPEDIGLIAKLFRTTKRTQIAATIEVWGIRDNGELDLLELLDTPLGEYPGSTERVYYYPGDIQL
jgi:hypothetical protein